MTLIRSLVLRMTAAAALVGAASPAFTQTLPGTPAIAPNVVPADVVTPVQDGAPTVASGLLPHDLSPWGMFLGADIVVQAVMVSLAFASVVTWTVLLAKSVELARAVRRQRRAFAIVAKARSLSDAAGGLDTHSSIGASLIEAATDELRQSADSSISPTTL